MLDCSVWEEIVPLLPVPKPKKKTGRPRMKDRQAMAAIFYLLRTRLSVERATPALRPLQHRTWALTGMEGGGVARSPASEEPASVFRARGL
jgi:hypothetical protein